MYCGKAMSVVVKIMCFFSHKVHKINLDEEWLNLSNLVRGFAYFWHNPSFFPIFITSDNKWTHQDAFVLLCLCCCVWTRQEKKDASWLVSCGEVNLSPSLPTLAENPTQQRAPLFPTKYFDSDPRRDCAPQWLTALGQKSWNTEGIDADVHDS